MRAALLLAFSIALGPFGCPQSASESESETTPGQVQPVPPEPAQPDETDTDEITSDPGAEAREPKAPSGPETLTAELAHSTVGFRVARATTGHIGHFERYRATLELSEGKPTRLEIRVETESVVADRMGLTSHLKSADFFDVAKYPAASFQTKVITAQPDEDDPSAYQIEGTMELHGVRGDLVFPATIQIGADAVVGKATLDISAKRFGINYAGMEAELADDAVALEIELTFPRVAG